MSKINVSINAESASELSTTILELAAAFSTTSVEKTVTPDPEEAPKADKPKRQNRKQKEKKETPPPPVDNAQEEEEDQVEESASEEIPVPDVIELRAVAREKGKTAEGKKAIKALLDEFGFKNISEIAEEKRAEFLVALEEL